MASTSDDSDLKEEKPGFATPEQQHPHNHGLHMHHSHHHNGRRFLHKIVHPHTGRTTHVCTTPEDLEKKRQELNQTEQKLEADFDIVLHGSPEHLDAVRSVHQHHESQQNNLKAQHAEVFNQFENVRNELDILNAELHMLTDHSVALDASFDKFGYSAHLRTKDDSDDSSLTSEHSAQAKHQDRSTNPLKFFKRPEVRQYFHKGLLWRSAKTGEVASFELFLDLVYVGVIDIIGERAVEHPDGSSLLHFVIIFCIGWKIWTDMTQVINWFDIDDIFQRISVAFYLICLFGFTTNVYYMFDEEESTYKSAIAFYIAQRLFLGLWFLMVAWLVPMVRGAMVVQSILITIAAVFWIGSMHVDWPATLALIWIGIIIDLYGGSVLIAFTHRLKRDGSFSRILKKWFEFMPAINIEHRVERNNAFVALVFGYSILTILYQSHHSFGINAFFGKGILGLIQAFAFNWIYFEIDAYGVHVHAIRRHYLSTFTWICAHLPFIMAYILAAATLSQLVLAHDCADADPETLGEHYIERSVAEIDDAMRWFYCCGIGVALFCMGVISFCHIHKKLDKARLLKRPRLAIRAAVSIIIICLPLAKGLNSLDLIAITCSLTVFVLIIDLYGNSCQGQRFWTSGMCPKERKRCTYTATCKMSERKRRKLKEQLARGEQIGLRDVLRRDSSMSTLGGSTQSSGSSTPTLRDEEWHGGHF